jgi:hypothetical protein
MCRKTPLLTLIFLFFLCATIVTASSTTRTAGVSKGDFFKYGNITVSGNSTAASTGYESLNQTLWMESNVTGVSGTNITGQLTTHYKNGTENTLSGLIDVNTGAGENLTIWFISANLGVNDTIYNSSIYSRTAINNTVPMTWAGTARDTNCLNVTYFSEVNANENYSENLLWYWDTPTGALVDFSLDYLNQTGADTATWTAHMGITDASVWTVSESPTWGLTFLILACLTSAVLIIRKRRLKANQ